MFGYKLVGIVVIKDGELVYVDLDDWIVNIVKMNV